MWFSKRTSIQVQWHSSSPGQYNSTLWSNVEFDVVIKYATIHLSETLWYLFFFYLKNERNWMEAADVKYSLKMNVFFYIFIFIFPPFPVLIYS